MVVTLGFALLTVISAALAVAFSDTRKVVISSWVASMCAGALFLCCGAEYLAVVQWIVGTLVSISFLVYASMFGEYGATDSRSTRDRFFDLIPALLLGAAFFCMVALGSQGVTGVSLELLPPAPVTAAAPTADLASVGQALTERHVISLELVGILLLTVLIGSGVISRPSQSEGEELK
jgi:NADH:ubiquinone oxidoreductase subunit 6 (subunit J)